MPKQHPNLLSLSIADSKVTLTNSLHDRVTTTNRFAQAWHNLDLVPVGILPAALRWVSSDGHIYALERPPQKTLIQYTPLSAANAAISKRNPSHILPRSRDLQIQLPWLLYVITLGHELLRTRNPDEGPLSLLVFARPGPLHTLGDSLYYTGLPNFVDGYRACLGSSDYKSIVHQVMTAPTIAAKLSTVVAMFWEGGFNNDVHPIASTQASTEDGVNAISTLPLGPDNRAFESFEDYLSYLEEIDVTGLDRLRFQESPLTLKSFEPPSVHGGGSLNYSTVWTVFSDIMHRSTH